MMPGGLANRGVLRNVQDGAQTLNREIAAQLAKTASDAEAKVKEKILAAASHHDGSLRRALAGSVTLNRQDRADGTAFIIRSDGRKLRGRSTLNKRANTGHWRHPVHGDEKVWVTQTWASAAGWFDGTLNDETDSMRAAVQRGMDAASRRTA